MAKKRISKRYNIAKSPISIYDASYEEMASSDKGLGKMPNPLSEDSKTRP